MVTFAEESSPSPISLSMYRAISDSETEWVPADSPSCSEFSATEILLITWNINAAEDLAKERFIRIITHLRKKALGDSKIPPPCCILLQEVHEEVLSALLKHEWVRDNFLVTPINAAEWGTQYGNITLVSNTVPVSTVFFAELPMSKIGRHAIFVDVHLSAPPPESEEQVRDKRIRTIRIANTHLEPEPPHGRRDVRPRQLKQIARLLNVPNIEAFICAGSMCSLGASDKVAPSQAGFADAYKGAKRDSMTWGYQPRTQRLPCRLDKVLYFPTERVEIASPTRIGFRARMATGRDLYLSDHCGLSTKVKVLRDC
ncbi:hypothetical protein K439DRAFT_1395822 [Ramaria rubella]|nr:hypothetical protein K439DRAFT_1395822 [Ramaria rubella]